MLGNPLKEGLLGNHLHLLTCLLVHETVAAGLLLCLGSMQDDLGSVAILENPAVDLEVLEDDEGLDGAKLQSLEGILNTVADAAGILANLLEVLADELLLLDELDVSEGLGRQLDGLVEAVFTTVRDIDNLDDLGLKTGIEQVGGVQVVLEIGGTSQNDTGNVGPIVGDEALNGQFGDLADVVVTLFLTETGKTQGGLTTTTVLLGKIDGELVDDVAGVSTKRTEQGTVTIHNDETELLVGVEKLGESFGVELVVAKVEGGVDGLERLEIDVDLSLLAFGGQDFTAVHDKTIGRHLVVQLEPLLGRGNGRKDGLTVDTRLNVRGSAL